MAKREYIKGCVIYIVGVGIPGIVVGTMVVPVAFSILVDLPGAGMALLLPNQPPETVEAAIADRLPTESPTTESPTTESASAAAPATESLNIPPYVAGTCEALKAHGLRNFFVGEPNYTPERDPDSDGLACEDPEQ